MLRLLGTSIVVTVGFPPVPMLCTVPTCTRPHQRVPTCPALTGPTSVAPYTTAHVSSKKLTSKFRCNRVPFKNSFCILACAINIVLTFSAFIVPPCMHIHDTHTHARKSTYP